MPCTRCNGTFAGDQFYDRVDEQGELRLGDWRWASRCAACGNVVDAGDGDAVGASSFPMEQRTATPNFQMFEGMNQ